MELAFEFATAGRIVFGPGSRQAVGGLTSRLGKTVLCVTGGSDRHSGWLTPLLEAAGLSVHGCRVPNEPTIGLVEAAVAQARTTGCDVILGVGGGSVLDAAKAIAALTVQPRSSLDYLELIGSGRPLDQEPLPCLAVPTTAGTGAEVTKNAVLGSPKHGLKISLRHFSMLPRIAIIDPELTFALPPAVTLATGLDALSQLIEPFVSPRANPLTDGFCHTGLERIVTALPAVLANPGDPAAREGMSLASLLGGLALANAGLGAVHGFAGPLGGMFPAPHGVLCGRLLAPVMAANIHCLIHGMGPAKSLERYCDIARIVTMSTTADPMDGVAWVQSLVDTAGLPRLANYGIGPAHIPEIIHKARQASSMKANPVVLGDEELRRILATAL
jgi:alcohol dehydrogenase class IV